MGNLRRVLVATDNSDLAPAVYVTAADLARTTGSDLVFAHVADPTEYTELQRETAMPLDHYYENLRATIRHEFRDATGVGDSARPVRVEVMLRERSVPQDLLDLAGRVHADLIVIGTHGRSGLRRALLGSVAEEVLRHAPCPVLVVPQTMLRARAKAAAVARSTAGVSHA